MLALLWHQNKPVGRRIDNKPESRPGGVGKCQTGAGASKRFGVERKIKITSPQIRHARVRRGANKCKRRSADCITCPGGSIHAWILKQKNPAAIGCTQHTVYRSAALPGVIARDDITGGRWIAARQADIAVAPFKIIALERPGLVAVRQTGAGLSANNRRLQRKW